ncbi:MAG TPA: 5,6-dimethylbenzimidazole synthase [Bradyrhizobium sp.]|nr:5,6-dimethylbenzimidazole synthase [Bradyrhizobium sp.]
MTEMLNTPSRHFDAGFRETLRELVLWRRDVRRFRRDPVDPGLIHSLIELASHAPSVGHCQPWRFVLVESAVRRAAVKESFGRANVKAAENYRDQERARYIRLKLEGLEDAPVHLAVFADETTRAGAGLGRQTMPEALRYSVVAAVQTFWLAARAEGLGVGWVSILEPNIVCRMLDVPETWTLVAYLCVGRPAEEHLDPELERHGWQQRLDAEPLIFMR